MNIIQEIQHLMSKEFQLEWKQRYAFNGLLLYIGSTVFLVYMAFIDIEPVTWVTVMWIILLFASANAVAKSFIQEGEKRQLYYYQLCSPQAVILSKIFYNAILLLIVSLLGILFYTLLLGNPVVNFPLFVFSILLGSVSFSTIFTMVSGIAFKAGGNSTLMPILSFPVLITVIALLIAVSTASLTDSGDINMNRNIGVLVSVNVLITAVSLILFPYLWRS